MPKFPSYADSTSMPLADEFSEFAKDAAGDRLRTDFALRARFSRLYRQLSEIDEAKALKRNRR